MPYPSGNENEVYLNENERAVYKVNNLVNSDGSILKFLDGVELHNKLFPLTKYQLIGFTGFDNRSVMPIIKQGYIADSYFATPTEITDYMKALGFKKLSDTSFTNGQYTVSDLLPRNVLKDSNGNIFVIDDMISENKQDKSNPVTWEPSDINYQHAYNAYSAISFDPEKRAAQTQRDYVDTLDELYNKLSALAKSPEQISVMWQQLERYKEGYLSHENAVLSAKSRTASPMITGPARFPTARNQKALIAEHNRSVEFSDWADKAEKTAIKAIKDAAPQEQKDDERWQSIKKTLDSKIASIIAIDKGEYPGARPLFVSSLSGFIKRMAANGQAEDVKKSLEYVKSVGDKHSKPIFSTNNEIWKLAETVQPKEDLTNKETEIVGKYKGVVIMNNHSQERVQLMFDEKPNPEIIATLKSRGFHWSPSQRAWQRKNTPDGIYTAQKLMGEFFEKDEANLGKSPSFQIKPKIFDTAKTISEKYEKGTQIIREVEKMFSANPSIIVKTNEDLANSVNAINYNEQVTEAIKHYFIGGLSLYGKVFINTLPHKTGNEIIRT